MGKDLVEIAEEIRNSTKKVNLIYAFNGTGKTRLSKEFQKLVINDSELTRNTILYYNANTEDLFYWDNDLENDLEVVLKIQPNSFINWIVEEQGQDQNIIENFQRYVDDKLTPFFDLEHNQVYFSFERGNLEENKNRHSKIKLSKGEESNFIWSIFYTLLELIISELSILDKNERSSNNFDNLKYIFIDDPVSSLDENSLIEVGSNLAGLIKRSNNEGLGIKFVITTHNPLFYNVLHNELNNSNRMRLEKLEDGTYELKTQSNDSPFAYHIFLHHQLKKAIEEDNIQKFHFNFLRNLYEKTSTFLGYANWTDLLPNEHDSKKSYEQRIVNLSSHSKHNAEEVYVLNSNEKTMLKYLFEQFDNTYRFYKE